MISRLLCLIYQWLFCHFLNLLQPARRRSVSVKIAMLYTAFTTRNETKMDRSDAEIVQTYKKLLKDVALYRLVS